jgi:hypothetical protein
VIVLRMSDRDNKPALLARILYGVIIRCGVIKIQGVHIVNIAVRYLLREGKLGWQLA